ncbi:MAG: Rrf2 family transcriptional regulator [Planctomycetia bacterium]|nr:Rrf2 family transcriptional regulator [Planctomycetia bacterium]
MTLLSRKADYALVILSYLFQHKEGGNARTIKDQFGLSHSFVANILKELCKKGFVTSHRGVKGGYALAPSAGAVSLAELLEEVEDGFQLTLCNHTTHDDACSHSAACTMKGPMAEVHQRLLGVLCGVTLAELFDPKARPSALHELPMLNTSCCSAPVESSPA